MKYSPSERFLLRLFSFNQINCSRSLTKKTAKMINPIRAHFQRSTQEIKIKVRCCTSKTRSTDKRVTESVRPIPFDSIQLSSTLIFQRSFELLFALHISNSVFVASVCPCPCPAHRSTVVQHLSVLVCHTDEREAMGAILIEIIFNLLVNRSIFHRFHPCNAATVVARLVRRSNRSDIFGFGRLFDQREGGRALVVGEAPISQFRSARRSATPRKALALSQGTRRRRGSDRITVVRHHVDGKSHSVC